MTEIRWTADEALAMDGWLIGEQGFTLEQLMATAGSRLADAAGELAQEAGCRRIVLLVGPGHNGGDAVVAEGHLRARWPTLVWRPLADDPVPELRADDLVVDGLFGVGLARPIEGAARAAVAAVKVARAAGARVLAVDVPSGLSATTGEIVGCTWDSPDGGVAIRADRTLAFVGPKAGFFVGAGPALVGEVSVVDLGFPVEEAEAWVVARRAQAFD